MAGREGSWGEGVLRRKQLRQFSFSGHAYEGPRSNSAAHEDVAVALCRFPCWQLW